MPTRVSLIPYTGHWQMNSSGPAGGSGHTHHRKSCECEVPPPPRDCRIGPAGSKSPRGLQLMAVRPSENFTLIGKSSGSLRLRLSISGVGSSSRPGVPGRMRRARKNSNPLA